MSTIGTSVDQSGDQRDSVENATVRAARSPPSSSICSLIFGNINGLPRDKFKKDEIKNVLQGSHGFMFAEHNAQTIPTPVLRNLVPSHYGKSCSISTNIEAPRTDTFSPGGTGMIVDGFLARFLFSRGVDDRHLGRWVWCTFRGRNNKRFTIISIYRSAPGWSSYNAQLALLRSRWTKDPSYLTSTADPVDVWFTDLSKLIKEKQSTSTVLVGGDFNDNLHDSSGPVQTFMRRHGLTDCMKSSPNLPTHTYVRGSTRRIDGVFASIPTRAGYYDFESSPSDHMWMFVEVPFLDLLGIRQVQVPSPPKQRVTSKNPIVMKQFNIGLSQQLLNHDIATKVDDLDIMLYTDSALRLTRIDAVNLHDSITEQTYRAISYANSKCRKIRDGAIPFSPPLKHIRIKIRFFKLLYRRNNPNYRSPKKRKLLRFAKIIHYTGSLNISLPSITALLRSALKEYNAISKSAYERRKIFLKSLAQAKADADDKPALYHLKQMLRQERSKSEFSAIRRAVGKVRAPPLTVIEKDTPLGRIRIEDPWAINHEIINAHKDKLTASKHTPLCQFPLSALLGTHGNVQKWKEVAEGTITIPPGFDVGVQEWLQYLQSTMPPPQEPCFWTPDEYYDSWKIMDEDTGTGPGPTFAAIKSVFKGSTAMHALSTIALFPLVTGTCPTLWKDAIEQCIPKKVDDLRPSKLRRISLFTCQLNHNKKLLGKKMNRFGEEHGILAPEQYGSRHNKSSIMHAINKRLLIDWTRTTKTSGIYIANDAKGCYDRILLLVAYLTMRRSGLTHEESSFSVSCLLDMRYRVRTAWGVSSEYYGGALWDMEFNMAPHGAGQGSGDGPSLWAGISSPLFDLMRQAGHYFHMMSSITRADLKLSGFGFVDDTDSIQLLQPEAPITSLLPQAQRHVDCWERLIRITGGALEPTKSKWIWMEQRWINGNWTYYDRPGPPLSMRGPEGSRNPMERVPVHQSTMTLGIYQSVTGDDTTEMEYLQTKIQEWCARLAAATLTHKQVQTAIACTINSTITYALPATCLSPAQCSALVKTLKFTALPRMGVVRSAAKVLVHGPRPLGGFGLIDVRLQQLVSHLRFLITFGGSTSVEGKLLSACLESTLLETGFSGNIFHTSPHLPWITSTWVWFTYRETSHYGFRIHANVPVLQPWRCNDSMIMEVLWKTCTFPLISWRRINFVRMALQIVTLSDISDNSGRRLLPSVLAGQTPLTCSSKAYHWTHNASTPSPTDLQVWTEALTTTFLLPQSSTLKPEYRLGSWLESSLPYTSWWQSTAMDLYHTTPDGSTLWLRQPSLRPTRRTSSHYCTGPVHQVPAHSVPAVVTQVSPTVVTFYPSPPTPIVPSPQRSFQHWTLTHLQGTPQEFEDFAAEVRLGNAKLLSDGSLKESDMGFAFVSVHCHSLGSANVVPSHPADASAHRSELGGLLAQIQFGTWITTTYSVTSGSIIGGSDCLNAIRFANDPWSTPTFDKSCYDMCQEISLLLEESPLTWTFQHVAGHQDDHADYATLDAWGQANVIADTRAKDAITLWRAQGSPPIVPAPTVWGVSIGSEPMRTSNVSKNLLEHHLGPPLMRFWIHRLKTSTLLPDMVHWGVVQRTFQRASPAVARFRAKHMAHISATGTNLKRRKEQSTDMCPLCGLPETNAHLLLCRQTSCCNATLTFIGRLTQYVNQCPTPLRSLLISLFHWCRGAIPFPSAPALERVMTAQVALGPLAFQWGLYSPLLVDAFTVALQPTKRSAVVWLSKFASFVWSHLQDLWILRNTYLHGSSNRITEYESEQINIDLTDLYQELAPIPTAFIPGPDKQFFQKFTLSDLISKSLKFRRKHLHQAKKISNVWRIRQSNPTSRFLFEFLLNQPPEPSARLRNQ